MPHTSPDPSTDLVPGSSSCQPNISAYFGTAIRSGAGHVRRSSFRRSTRTKPDSGNRHRSGDNAGQAPAAGAVRRSLTVVASALPPALQLTLELGRGRRRYPKRLTRARGHASVWNSLHMNTNAYK